MRPGVGREDPVVVAEGLAQVSAEAVIDRAAVGVVRVHVAEGNAAGVGERRGRWIARRVEAWQSLENGNALSYAIAATGQILSSGYGRIESARTEEVHHSSVYVRERRRRIPRRVAPTTREGAGGRSLSLSQGIVKGCLEVGDHQIAPHGVGI